MRQVLLRALYLLRRPSVLGVALLISVGGSALVVLPLFGVPGYELGGAVAAGVGILGCIVGAAAAFQERRLIQGRDPRPPRAAREDGAMGATLLALGAAVVVNLAVVIPPFAVSVLYAWVSSRCNPFAQAGFYPLLTIPSALLASAAGVFAGLRARGAMAATVLVLVLLIASGLVTAWPLCFGPQVYAFNHFAGFFPGPLYDEALAVHAPLVWFRLQTVLVAAFLWLLGAFFLDMKEGRIRRPHFRPGAFALLALIALGFVALEERAPQLGIRMTPEYLEDRLGGSRDTDHFHLVYTRGKPREDVERVVRDLEFRYEQVADFLGGAPSEKIRVYLYASPQEKESLVGASSTQFAKPWRLELHVNDGPFPSSALKHELVHVLASRFGTGPFKVATRWGVVPNMGVIEGLAVAGENPVNELTLHEWAAGMRKEKLAPDVRSLFRTEGFYASAAARAYTYAGSFLRYLADTYGREKLQTLYAHGDFERAYGRSVDGLATEWEAFLDKLPLDAAAQNQAFARFRQGSIFARACAREVAALSQEAQEELRSDPEKALGLFERCAKLQPDEPSFQMSQVAALDALDRRGDALIKLEAVAAQVKDQPTLLADVLMSRADLQVRMDKKQDAVSALQEVLRLNTNAATDRTARVKLAALNAPRVGPALWAYFRPAHEDVKLLVLREALAAEPDNPFIQYLLGRRLEQGGAPMLAVAYLAKALAGDLPGSLRKEALRLKVEADYLAGDCAGVNDDAGHLPDLGAPLKAQALEWVQRCAFEDRAFKGPLVPAEPFR